MNLFCTFEHLTEMLFKSLSAFFKMIELARDKFSRILFFDMNVQRNLLFFAIIIPCCAEPAALPLPDVLHDAGDFVAQHGDRVHIDRSDSVSVGFFDVVQNAIDGVTEHASRFLAELEPSNQVSEEGGDDWCDDTFHIFLVSMLAMLLGYLFGGRA
jgi:hypothetical protein